jgi:hypothetical protein
MYYYALMKNETLTVETDEDGTITYRNADGKLHNPHGPAIVCANGEKWYYINGKLHNPNGPAIIWANGHKEHWINGKRHNPNGPAVIWHDGSKEYYINGKPLTKTEFAAWQAQQDAPLHNKTATIDGVEYTLTTK